MSREIIQKGEWADQVLKNPAYASAIDDMKIEIFNEFRKTELSDVDKREDIHRLMRAADIFEAQLLKRINNMVAEKAKLNKKEPKRII